MRILPGAYRILPRAYHATYRIRYCVRHCIRYRCVRYFILIYDIMYNIGIRYRTRYRQDTLCLVAQYPFRMEPLEDFDPLTDFDMMGGDDVWFARPQLFFSCSLCPTGQTENKYSHRAVSLVFFSTFKSISLTPHSCMQKNGIPMVYERASSHLPTLYVCLVQNILGKIPLVPCFFRGLPAV